MEDNGQCPKDAESKVDEVIDLTVDEDESSNSGPGAEPDRSKSDFYCKNTNKEPGEQPGKIRAIIKDDAIPALQQRLEKMKEPVVGLEYMCELQKAEPNNNSYSCYLCHAHCNTASVISHITSMKHRLNYLKKVDEAAVELINSMEMKKDVKSNLIADKAYEWELKKGRGEMEVKLEKSKPSAIVIPKRPLEPDDENFLPRKRSLFDMAGSGVPTPSHIGISRMDIKLFSADTKLRLLEELSQNEVTSDTESKAVMSAINTLTQVLMQYKIRHLPSDLQQRLSREILSGDIKSLESTISNVSMANQHQPSAMSQRPSETQCYRSRNPMDSYSYNSSKSAPGGSTWASMTSRLDSSPQQNPYRQNYNNYGSGYSMFDQMYRQRPNYNVPRNPHVWPVDNYDY